MAAASDLSWESREHRHQKGTSVSIASDESVTIASSLPAEAVEALRGTLRGSVLVSVDPEYDAARAVWNAMIDRHPAAIARCKGTADVLDVVRFARTRRLPISIRGGGHNVAGHAVADG